jgi:hypothetical protein
MLAVLDMVEPLQNENFHVWKQTRIGLLSHPLDPDAARGHLAAATYLQMALRPDIYHIVGHTEAHHAATAEDIIEASRIARRAIENALHGAPDMTADPAVLRRRKQLVKEAGLLLDAIASLAEPHVEDPFLAARTLTRAVTCGLLDAPQLCNNNFGRGEIRTGIYNGASVTVDPKGRIVREKQRLSKLMQQRRIQ